MASIQQMFQVRSPSRTFYVLDEVTVVKSTKCIESTHLITARRYANAVGLYAVVCVSVTRRYCIKTAKRGITQATPHDSLEALVF